MSAIEQELFQPRGPAQPDPEVAAAATPFPGELGALLPRLLRAMDWQRSERVLASAIAEPAPLSLAGFAQTLRRLGFEVTLGTAIPAGWHSGTDGALVRVARNGDAEALVRRAGAIGLVTPETEMPPGVAPRFRPVRYAWVVNAQEGPLRRSDPTLAWTPYLRRVTRGAFTLSFFINLLALSVPIFSMEIYDRVIGGNAPEVLPWFWLGAGLAIGLMLVLRRQRSRLLAGAHASLGYHLSLAVLDRMLRLPLLVSGKLRRAGLVSRVRELERVRDRLAAVNTTVVFDAPFILLSLLAVAAVGGWLVLVPVVYLLLAAGVAWLVNGYVAAGARLASQAVAEREALLADLAEQAPALLATQAAEGWSRRFLEISANAVRGSYIQGARLGLAQSAAYVLGTGAALATLAAGVELVLAGSMTAGGLIASMLLIWRITAPAQALFLGFSRLRQADAARAQVERFFASPYDASDAGKREPAHLDVPSLVFERVTFRYTSDQDPALAGISFRLEPGETLAVVGPNGSGKTTLLRLAAGLLEPQGGLILLGGRNVGQFDPEDLRLVVGYYPEHPATFMGTLADNLRAAAPRAGDEALHAAIQQAWPQDRGQHLSAGLDTRLPLPESQGLAEEDDQRIGLARLLLEPKPLLLIADPVENAGPDAPRQVRAVVEEAKAFIQALRGRSTIVLATQNPELIALADKALVLDKGQAAAPVPTIAVDSITPDNVINAAEAGTNVDVTGTVAGEFSTGDTVTLTVGGQAHSGQVDAAGKFSISVPGSELQGATSVHATVSTTDAAGNSGSAVIDHAYSVDAGAPAVTVNAVALTNDNTPDITGTTDDPRATIEVMVGGHSYTATNNGDGTWTLPGSQITSPIPDGASNPISVTATDTAGNQGSASATAAIDTAAPVPTIAVDAITPDNVINAAEAGGDVAVTGTVGGEFNAGDTVTLTVGGQTHTGQVDVAGRFSISIPGSELQGATSLHAAVATTDAAGNPGSAALDHGYTVDATLPQPTLAIDSVTTDDVLNAAEAGQTIPVTGTVGGDFSTGDTVTLSINGTDFTGQVDAQGKFSIDVPGADLKADPDTRIDGSVTATDAAGNTATATAAHGYTVDSAPPQPPTVTQVAGAHTTHLSGVLAGGTGGWAIDSGHGVGVLSLQGQFGTLTIDPQTGQFDYHYRPDSAVVKSGGSSGPVGQQVDTFHIMQHGTHTSDAEVRVNINVQSMHGQSGHHIDHPTLEGIDIVPVPQAQHDEPVPDVDILDVAFDLQDVSAVPSPPVGRSVDVLGDQDPVQQGAEGEQHPEIVASVYHGHPTESADVPSLATLDLATASAKEPASQADQPSPAADHLAPYLAMIGAEGGGNGGQPPGADAAASYLGSLGLTPGEAAPEQPDLSADPAGPVPATDPFAEPPEQQHQDALQAIEGSLADEAPMNTAPVPDADLDPQHHG